MTAPACTQSDCTGTIEDGYCTICGIAPTPESDATSGSSTPMLSTGPSTSATGPPTAAAGPPTSATEPPTSDSEAGISTPNRGSGSWSSSPSARSGSNRDQLGGGLVDVPPVPVLDPASVLLTDPQVPEDRRFCSRCGEPVGRSRDGRPGRTEGFCPKDGAPFSFSPKLHAGELVAGQYEVRGALAHGGLGWIYLAVDHRVNDRWVVLKGLLDSGDAHAMTAAVAERRFLAEVDHPNIVKIYNFVEHPAPMPDPASGSSVPDGVAVGYIVMEYVGGSSLKQLLAQRRQPDGSYLPLPVEQSIAYATEVLSALGYLHSRGLAYCDFKPDNAIQYDRRLKLIDLGAVIGLDDHRSAVYGTVGYQAPEVSTRGPSVRSDIYTVGRSLAVLALGLPPIRRDQLNPIPDEHPVLEAHESFRLALLRATDPDPLCRFYSCAEMAEQLDGVLREVLSAKDGKPRPATSTLFGPPRGSFAADLLISPDHSVGRPVPGKVASALPLPLVDPDDPGSGVLANLGASTPAQVHTAIENARAQLPALSPELRLRLVRASLEAGKLAYARRELDELAKQYPDEWRVDWYQGLAWLHTPESAGTGPTAAEFLSRASRAFSLVFATFPGEAAPKLALAAIAECTDQDGPDTRHYPVIARPDPALADAVFGWARVALRAGDRDTAMTALDSVPESSSHYLAAQLAATTVLLFGRGGTEIGLPALHSAAENIHRLNLDPAIRAQVRAELLTAALQISPGNGQPLRRRPSVTQELRAPTLDKLFPELFTHPLEPIRLRLGLEQCLRTRARLCSDPGERIALVDQANAVRPQTWT